jgi:hypothetical protein
VAAFRMTAVTAEMLENVKNSTWHIPESQSYILNSRWKKLRTRTVIKINGKFA